MRKYEEQLDRLITHKLREVAESGSVSTAYTTGFEYDVADEIMRTMDQSAQMAALEHLLFQKISGTVQEDALLETDREEGYNVVQQMATILYNAVVGQDPEAALTNLLVSEIIRRARALGATA
jgi:hypothetical protein